MSYPAVYAATLGAFFILDALWISLFAAGFFKSQLGPLVRSDPVVPAIVAFYLIYALGLVALCVAPARAANSQAAALIKGALLGLTAYATYDLTNLALVPGWTPAVAAVDIAWGIVSSALACLVGYSVSRGPRPAL